MATYEPPPKQVVIDERWIPEWLEFGFAEMTTFLGKHAAFDAYYERRAQSEKD